MDKLAKFYSFNDYKKEKSNNIVRNCKGNVMFLLDKDGNPLKIIKFTELGIPVLEYYGFEKN